MSHVSLRRHSRAAHQDKLRRIAGHEAGGAVKKLITKGIHEHEDHEHGGEHTRLKFKDGGAVEGKHGHHRMDRAGRAHGGSGMKSDREGAIKYDPNDLVGEPTRQRKDGGAVTRAAHARGGNVKGKGHGKTHINVIVAQPAEKQPVPIPVPARPPMGVPPGGPPPAMPPRPPMAPPGGGGAPMMPPGAGAGMPLRKAGGRVMRADGGKVQHIIDDGAGGGEGRLEKIKAYGKNADANKKERYGGMKGKLTPAKVTGKE